MITMTEFLALSLQAVEGCFTHKEDEPMTAHRKIVPAWLDCICGVRSSTSNDRPRISDLVPESREGHAAILKLHTTPSMVNNVKLLINPSSRAILIPFSLLSLALNPWTFQREWNVIASESTFFLYTVPSITPHLLSSQQRVNETTLHTSHVRTQQS